MKKYFRLIIFLSATSIWAQAPATETPAAAPAALNVEDAPPPGTAAPAPTPAADSSGHVETATPPDAETYPPATTMTTDESGMMKLIQPFVYNKTETSRDPFKLPEVSLVPLTPGPFFGPFLGSQDINLDDVTLKGIILDPTRPKALIGYKDSNGKDTMTTVTIGDAIGDNFGRVQAIRDGKVIIVQTLEENGAWRTTTRVISVRK